MLTASAVWRLLESRAIIEGIEMDRVKVQEMRSRRLELPLGDALGYMEMGQVPWRIRER